MKIAGCTIEPKIFTTFAVDNRLGEFLLGTVV